MLGCIFRSLSRRLDRARGTRVSHRRLKGWMSRQEIFEFALAVVAISSGKELRVCMEMADFGVSKRADLF